MREYEALAAAQKIIEDARRAVYAVTGSYFNSPADDKLINAKRYLATQQAAILAE